MDIFTMATNVVPDRSLAFTLTVVIGGIGIVLGALMVLILVFFAFGKIMSVSQARAKKKEAKKYKAKCRLICQRCLRRHLHLHLQVHRHLLLRTEFLKRLLRQSARRFTQWTAVQELFVQSPKKQVVLSQPVILGHRRLWRTIQDRSKGGLFVLWKY